MPNLKMKNASGEEVILNDVDTLVLQNSEGEQEIFSYGTAVENVKIDLDLENGDQTITTDNGILLKNPILKIPEDLKPENILRGRNIFGVDGSAYLPASDIILNMEETEFDFILEINGEIMPGYDLLPITHILPGVIYDITWDDVTYQCMSYEVDGGIFIGNYEFLSSANVDFNNLKEPFIIGYADGMIGVIDFYNMIMSELLEQEYIPTTHKLSITIRQDLVEKYNEKLTISKRIRATRDMSTSVREDILLISKEELLEVGIDTTQIENESFNENSKYIFTAELIRISNSVGNDNFPDSDFIFTTPIVTVSKISTAPYKIDDDGNKAHAYIAYQGNGEVLSGEILELSNREPFYQDIGQPYTLNLYSGGIYLNKYYSELFHKAEYDGLRIGGMAGDYMLTVSLIPVVQ